mgnify:CR=1 FL=1
MIDQIRREKKQGNFDEVDARKLAHSRQYSDLNEILHEALNTLPEKQKSVILLRDYEGYSYQEIGEITEMSESQVKVYIFRARKALKNYIGSIEAVIWMNKINRHNYEAFYIDYLDGNLDAEKAAEMEAFLEAI